MSEGKKMVRVADYIMRRLHDEGVRHVFMVTGRGALFLNDAVAANKDLEDVCMHHEQAAAYAAVAYADYTGKPGACLVSTGCAGTNAITGVLNAWQDGIPCVFISGQNKLEETSRYTGIPLRTYGQQEADIVPVVSPITKYAVMITVPNSIVYELEKALHLALSGRKGPVWIDVPLDVQNMRICPEDAEKFVPKEAAAEGVSSEDLNFVLSGLKCANRPVVLIGSGIRSAEAEQGLRDFLDKTSIPVAYASSAPDLVGLEDPLSVGSVGIMGCTRSGNFAVQNSDFLLVLGCRLSSMTTGECCKFGRDAKVVVVDIDKVEHSKSPGMIDRLVEADVGEFLSAIVTQDLRMADQAWRDKCSHWKEIFPRCEDGRAESEKVDLYYLADSLSEAMSDDSVLITDSGLIELIIPNNVSFRGKQRAIHPASQGSMGFALPAIVGAHYASGSPVVTVVGDGSIMMNLQELETIRYKKIPAKIMVINNNAYAVIRKRQVELFRRRTIGTDPSNGVGCPDFEKIAAGFEIPYVKIEKSAELKAKLSEVLVMEGPVLCEIMGDENQDYINVSHVRNAERKVVQRPIEDQAPFLDRDLFLSEMVVEPIDQ